MELRDTLDACLEKNMWFFSIGELLLLLLLQLQLPSMHLNKISGALPMMVPASVGLSCGSCLQEGCC
jgi:hypothetical protein